jgi:hypothetical protein
MTPPGATSFVTVADTGTFSVAVTVAGGAWVSVIAGAPATIVVLTEAGLAGFAAEAAVAVAVIVTVLPNGIAAGAV